MNKTLITTALILTVTACGGNGGGNGNPTTPHTPPTTNGKFETIPAAPSNLTHKLAIVYSKTSEQNFWNPTNYSQLFRSVQTQAMMAGLPYDLINEDDLLDINKIKKYKTLLFPLFSYVKENQIEKISKNIKTAVQQYNVGIVTAGNFLTNTETGTAIAGDSYRYMKDILGIKRLDGAGPLNFTIKTTDVTHPALVNEYNNNETILSYSKDYTDYFMPTGAYPSRIIAEQILNGSQVENELIAITNKGRHAHFATVQAMADANLLWSILQWSVWGNKSPATLQMGREKALFSSRTDMDQSMYAEEVGTVEVPLLNQLKIWKNRYNFVGSYYLNVGNRPSEGEYTDWGVSAPLYKQYIQLGNEIGSHSYTHPDKTNELTASQINFEFASSRAIIENKMGLKNIGAAVPGNPENLATSKKIISHVDYLSGGYSARGSGFPNGFGFLTADSNKVYLSPNMSFDFTLIGFQHKTPAQAKQIWNTEFNNITKHAKQAIIHWPWHDYGPNDTDNAGYTLDMYEGFISKAKNYGSEFLTAKDLSLRIKSFKNSAVDISPITGNKIVAKVKSNNSGQFSLKLNKPKMISSVDKWYAYNQDTVFLNKNGGIYTIRLGSPKALTHITKLPGRSKLLSLSGNGEDIKFKFSGKGKVQLITKCTNPSSIKISGGLSTYQKINSNNISLNFPSNKSYTETIVDITCP
ncbi:MAG: hypothetical protein DSZ29_03720 [Aquificaceae bacterium]|nr:MAG: hypothetical protein DSZ29_03720 [Aquificaceae bacterium]